MQDFSHLIIRVLLRRSESILFKTVFRINSVGVPAALPTIDQKPVTLTSTCIIVVRVLHFMMRGFFPRKTSFLSFALRATSSNSSRHRLGLHSTILDINGPAASPLIAARLRLGIGRPLPLDPDFALAPVSSLLIEVLLGHFVDVSHAPLFELAPGPITLLGAPEGHVVDVALA